MIDVFARLRCSVFFRRVRLDCLDYSWFHHLCYDAAVNKFGISQPKIRRRAFSSARSGPCYFHNHTSNGTQSRFPSILVRHTRSSFDHDLQRSGASTHRQTPVGTRSRAPASRARAASCLDATQPPFFRSAPLHPFFRSTTFPYLTVVYRRAVWGLACV